MNLLKQLCYVASPSGEEFRMKEFILDYIQHNKKKWKKKPRIIHGEGFQDCIVMVFGKPRTAMFAHMDTVGFHVRYEKELITIGSPVVENGIKLVGEDPKGKIDCQLDTKHPDYNIAHDFFRTIERGTSLTFKPVFKEKEEFIEASFLDNRLGLWVMLRMAEIIENGILVFTAWEEHKGGSSEFLSRFIYNKYNIKQTLIADVTWVNRGIKHGDGVVISRRDSGIPRKSYFDRIVELAKSSYTHFQIEVEHSGATDGVDIQKSPYPIDWCVVGVPVQNVHTPNEIVHKIDLFAMYYLYSILMNEL